MIIIKIGGGKTINIDGIIRNLSKLHDELIIIHGANAKRDEIMKNLGFNKKVLTSVKGYSSVYSDKNTIDAIMMSYSGIVNKRIVELCQQNGINAIGLSGIDGRLIQGKRNLGIRIKQGEKTKIIRDFSGKPKKVNVNLLKMLLHYEYTPVISIPILDENNYAINSENDDIINVLQKVIHAKKIISFIEAPGFLEDVNNEKSLVKKMNKNDLQKREGSLEGRMKRKILALKNLLEDGAAEVIISDGRIEDPISHALNGGGTLIQ